MNTDEMKLHAEAIGRSDAQDGSCFDPEQLGQWLHPYYTLGFLAEQPDNFAAQAWMKAHMARIEAKRQAWLEAEEDEMNLREDMAAHGARWVGGMLVTQPDAQVYA